MRLIQALLPLFLLFLTGFAFGAEPTVEDVEAMGDQPRAEYLQGFILRAETALQAARDHATTPQDRNAQQLALSITIALFGGPKDGWSALHHQSWNLPLGLKAVLRGASDQDRKEPLGTFVGGYVEHRYAELMKRPASAWLPQQGETYQEAYARMVFSAPPLATIDCQTMYTAMLEGGQHALVEQAALYQFQKLTSAASGPATDPSVQTNRLKANLLRVLFFGDGSSLDKPPAAYDDASCGPGDTGTFLHNAGYFFNWEVENMTPWVNAAEGDAEQQSDFRYLFSLDRARGSGPFTGWFTHYGLADGHRVLTDELVVLAVEEKRLQDEMEAARTVTIYNDGRPAVSAAEPLEAQLKPLEAMMPSFDARTKLVLDGLVRPLVAPIDPGGRHKQPGEALVARDRGEKILKIFTGHYSDPIATMIYTTYRRTGSVDFDTILEQYIAQELGKQ